MKTALTVLAASALACLTAAPAMAQPSTTPKTGTPVVYVAHLHSMNSKVTGADASGVAQFTIRGDKLTIRVVMRGVPPDIEH
jgi:hypothetical protein